MKKSACYYTIRHYAFLVRRYALGSALAFLMLYQVCDYLAQIRPLTVGTLFQTCQRDMSALLARSPYGAPSNHLNRH